MILLNLSSIPTEWNQALSTRYMSFWTWFLRMCVFNSWKTPMLANSISQAHPWCGASPSCGISINLVSSSDADWIVFQGIVPTLIIVQIGLGRDAHDIDTTASMVQSGFISTNDQYDLPPTEPPPPMSTFGSPTLPPSTYTLTNQRTSRLIEMPCRTNEVEESEVSWLGSYISFPGCLTISGRVWESSGLLERRTAVLMIAPWC